MARVKTVELKAPLVEEVTSEVTPVVEPAPEAVPTPVITINLDPVPDEEPPLSAQTLAEMEAGRASIAQFNPK